MAEAAQTKAYIANTAADHVTVVDTADNSVVTTVAVGPAPTHVVLSTDGTRAFVINSGIPFSISVIQTADDTEIARIPVDAPPMGVAPKQNGDTAYVLLAGGVVRVLDVASKAVVGDPIDVGGSDGGIAITPDGSHVYVAADNISVIDTATNTVVVPSFAPEMTHDPTVFNFAVSVAVSADGKKAYVGYHSYFDSGILGFTASGGLVVVDTVSNTVSDVIPLFSLPGSIALSSDATSSRAYVAIDFMWFNSGYGAAFFPGRTIAAIDTASKSPFGWIDLGAEGPLWSDQHTPADLAVTPDRASVLVSIPAFNRIARIDTATNVVDNTFLLDGKPTGVAINSSSPVAPTPFVIDAVDDTSASPLPASAAKAAIANVLANDTLGGAPAATASVTLLFVSATTTGVILNTETGAVWTNADAAAGPQSLVYKICEMANPDNCDTATASFTVRDAYVIDAVDDHAMSFAGATALANVTSNDTLNAAAAGPSNVTLWQVSASDDGIGLNAADGSVFVTATASIGDHALVYRICESESPSNCDDAMATVTVIPHAVHAQNDSATTSRTGGNGIANVLANDTFDGVPATLAQVTLLVLSSSSAGVTLNAATGAVSVAGGTPAGLQTLSYRVCETARPSNCSDASVSITVNSYVIFAGADRGRGSNKTANTPIANVLANDTLGGAPATTANVTLSQVSLTPANRDIRLNLATGAVEVLRKTTGGTYSLVYQICEIGTPTNCSQATATIDLSGR
jgi:YVTN family beta-propeller protein